ERCGLRGAVGRGGGSGGRDGSRLRGGRVGEIGSERALERGRGRLMGDEDDATKQGRGGGRWAWLVWALGGVGIIAAVAVIALGTRGPAAPDAAGPSDPAGPAVPAHMSAASVRLLRFDELSGTPTPAPDFHLTD